MSIEFEPIRIPDKYSELAKEVADLAVKHSIKHFKLAMKPHWKDFSGPRKVQVLGDLSISFSDADGRGRPCRNLTIELNSNVIETIEETPSSHD